VEHEQIQLVNEVDGGWQSFVELVHLLDYLRLQTGQVGDELTLVLLEVFDTELELPFEGEIDVHEHLPEVMEVSVFVHGLYHLLALERLQVHFGFEFSQFVREFLLVLLLCELQEGVQYFFLGCETGVDHVQELSLLQGLFLKDCLVFELLECGYDFELEVYKPHVVLHFVDQVEFDFFEISVGCDQVVHREFVFVAVVILVVDAQFEQLLVLAQVISVVHKLSQECRNKILVLLLIELIHTQVAFRIHYNLPLLEFLNQLWLVNRRRILKQVLLQVVLCVDPVAQDPPEALLLVQVQVDAQPQHFGVTHDWLVPDVAQTLVLPYELKCLLFILIRDREDLQDILVCLQLLEEGVFEREVVDDNPCPLLLLNGLLQELDVAVQEGNQTLGGDLGPLGDCTVDVVDQVGVPELLHLLLA